MDELPKVFYDHTIFSIQKFGGISRYYAELIRHSIGLFETEVGIKYSDNQHLKDILPNLKIFPYPKEIKYGQNFLQKKRNKILQFLKFNPPQIKGVNYFEINQKITLKELCSAKKFIFHPTYYEDYFFEHLGNRPAILTVYDLIHEIFSEYFSLSDATIEKRKKLLDRANHIIAISHQTKHDLIEIYGLPEEKVSVIHLSHSFVGNLKVSQVFSEKINQVKPYLLYTGNRSGYKNFYFFVRCWAVLSKKFPEVHLVCTGPSFSDEEVKLFHSLGLVDKIHYISANEEQLFALYQNALAFVFPSLYEGFGIPVLEAFQAGCPALLSDIPVFKEIASNAALFFKPKSYKDMAEKLEYMIIDSKLRESLRQQGSIIASQFSWQKTAKETASVYRNFI